MLETFKEKKSAASVVTDQATIKKRRMMVSSDYAAKAFISVDFN